MLEITDAQNLIVNFSICLWVFSFIIWKKKSLVPLSRQLLYVFLPTWRFYNYQGRDHNLVFNFKFVLHLLLVLLFPEFFKWVNPGDHVMHVNNIHISWWTLGPTIGKKRGNFQNIYPRSLNFQVTPVWYCSFICRSVTTGYRRWIQHDQFL